MIDITGSTAQAPGTALGFMLAPIPSIERGLGKRLAMTV